MSIRIPASIDEAVSSLNGVAALLTAKQWERAAIVYAFTTDEINGGPRTGRNSGQLSLREFATLGITGLRSREQVRAYRDAWQSAIDAGPAEEAVPGQEVELPSLPWDDHFLATLEHPQSSLGALQRDCQAAFQRRELRKTRHESFLAVPRPLRSHDESESGRPYGLGFWPVWKLGSPTGRDGRSGLGRGRSVRGDFRA